MRMASVVTLRASEISLGTEIEAEKQTWTETKVVGGEGTLQFSIQCSHHSCKSDCAPHGQNPHSL